MSKIINHDASGNPTKIASTNVTGDTLVIGSIQIWPSDTIPYGWLLCNGQAVSRTTYNELFATIGTTHGSGDGSTTFNVPDMRDYIVIGKSSTDTNIDTIGKKYGSKTHGLTVDEMPSHDHAVQQRANDPTPVASFYDTNYTAGAASYNLTSSAKMVTTGITNSIFVAKVGGGTAHNNMQPSIAENYIIKAKQTPGVVAKVIDNLNSTSATDALSANQGRLLNDRLSNLLDIFYPVGTIYETTSTDLDTTTKMAAHFGGTWEVYGDGRVLVAKSTDTEFDTIGETGGAKTHTLALTEIPAHHHQIVVNSGASGLGTSNIALANNSGTNAFPNTYGDVGGGLAHNNLPPYIVVYRYRRTA